MTTGTGREMTIQGEVGIIAPPEIVLENAHLAAKALISVVSQKKKPVIMNGEQYLEYEDWQTAGQFYGYAAKTRDATPVEIDGVKGAKAYADLIDMRTGEVIGGAEAYCMRDEEHWNTRPKYEWQGEGSERRRVRVADEIVPWFQLASMAQTRAGAKAFRNRLAWVAVLAGYRPTPAEEMTDSTATEAQQERRTVDRTQHYCSVHNVNFFKHGRMKGWAHPIDGTDPVKWCNEPDPTKEPPRQGPTVEELHKVREQVDEAITRRTKATEPTKPSAEKVEGQGVEEAGVDNAVPAWEDVKPLLDKLIKANAKGWNTGEAIKGQMVKAGALETARTAREAFISLGDAERRWVVRIATDALEGLEYKVREAIQNNKVEALG